MVLNKCSGENEFGKQIPREGKAVKQRFTFSPSLLGSSVLKK